MPGGVQRPRLPMPEGDRLVAVKLMRGRRWRLPGLAVGAPDPERLGLHDRVVVEPAIVRVEQDPRAGAGRHLAGRHDMIEVRVRVDQLHGGEPATGQRREDRLGLVSRIDHQRLARLGAADDGAVAAERADREGLAHELFGGHRAQRRRSGTPLTISTTDSARSDRIWLAFPAMLMRRRSGTLAGRNPRPISVVTTTAGVVER